MKRIGHRKGMRIAGWALICACALAVLLRLPAALADKSGTWGSLNWKYTEAAKKLTISGNGVMKAFSYDSKSAWHQDSMRDYIETVEIGSGVTTIGDYAFATCRGVNNITFKGTVTSIGEYAFYMTNFKEFTVPSGVTEIKSGAFSYTSSLISITLPASVKSIMSNAFEEDYFLRDIHVPDLTSYLGIQFVSFLDGTSSPAYNCLNMRANCRLFLGNSATEATEITVPQGTKSIGRSAFRNFSNLTSITLPDSVTEIGAWAFAACSSLTDFRIPDGVQTIEERTFSGCSSLESIVVPSGVTTIGQGAFSNCTGLKHIVIPDSVTAIGQEAFSGCTGLKHIIIPNKKTTIGADAFKDCEDLILYHSDNPSVVQYAADNGMTAVSNGEDWSSAPAGENAWYELYSDGTLFIRGSGALYDYTRNCNGQLSAEDWGTVREIVIDPRITFSFTEESFPEENKPAIRTELAELRLEEGESLDLTGCFTVDACFALDRVTLASGDEEIAAVQEETLTALAFGETELTVSAADYPALSITLPVRVGHHFVDGVCTGCGAICPPAGVMNWLTLPEDTVRVEAGAFEKGDFDAVRIPEGCAEIESRAFADCPNLKYVTAGPDTVIAPDAFAGCGSVLVNRGE